MATSSAVSPVSTAVMPKTVVDAEAVFFDWDYDFPRMKSSQDAIWDGDCFYDEVVCENPF